MQASSARYQSRLAKLPAEVAPVLLMPLMPSLPAHHCKGVPGNHSEQVPYPPGPSHGHTGAGSGRPGVPPFLDAQGRGVGAH